MLGMTTFEVGDPVPVLILVKADDAALNRRPVRKSQWSSVIQSNFGGFRLAA